MKIKILSFQNETYGSWNMKNYPESISVEYWFNEDFPKPMLPCIGILEKNFKKNSSVSLQNRK